MISLVALAIIVGLRALGGKSFCTPIHVCHRGILIPSSLVRNHINDVQQAKSAGHNNGSIRQVQPSRVTPLLMAGFGGSNGSSKSKKSNKKGSSSSAAKLKPKQQWDRYEELKKETIIRVAVRTGGEGDWLEVGRVKSKNDEYTELAIVAQRGLIADHSRRLYPLKVSVKDKMEWAYFVEEDDDWKVVSSKGTSNDEMPKDFGKLIGFEGRPDPATGFYCMYDRGMIVGSGEQNQRQ